MASAATLENGGSEVNGFLVIGFVGLVIVVASLLLGDAFEGLFDALDIDTGSGLFSAPVIGAFLAAFGFGAALVMVATGTGAVGGASAGLAAGFGFGAIAFVLTRSLMNMGTDETVRVADLVGKSGTVVTRIPGNGYGEVAVVHLGHRLKLNAKAPHAIPTGTSVVVVEVASPSSVLVEPAAEFWRVERLGGM